MDRFNPEAIEILRYQESPSDSKIIISEENCANVNCQRWTDWILAQCAKYASESKVVLEVGGEGRELQKFIKTRKFLTVNLPERDICKQTEYESGSCDLILCKHSLEHIQNPFDAASEMKRLLAPGGILIVITHWSWCYHTAYPYVNDYWRFSVSGLKRLFGDLNVLENGYDLTERRKDIRMYDVKQDEMGGWRENWNVFLIAEKTLNH